MQQSEKLKDQLFRYQYIYPHRRTEKSKQRFLSALVKDISDQRKDIQVIEYDRQKKAAARNVYVGNIQTAERIICTYYDTPPKHFGSYVFFDRKDQGRKTLQFILFTSVLMIVVGLIMTLAYMYISPDLGKLTAVTVLSAIVLYGSYFYFLGKVTQGWSSARTLIRNTSSLLVMFLLMEQSMTKKTAFAFLDEGSYGENGLTALQESCKKTAEIFLLDCIGADAPIHLVGKKSNEKEKSAAINVHTRKCEVNYLFAARTTRDAAKTKFYLTQAELKKKKLNMKNIADVVEFLK